MQTGITTGAIMRKYQNLLAQKAALEKAIARTRQREIGKVIKEINTLIQEYDLSVSDLRFASTARSAKVKQAPPRAPVKGRRTGARVVPQYRDPQTGATWSGRGRTPAWIVGDKQHYRILDDQNRRPDNEPVSPESLA